MSRIHNVRLVFSSQYYVMVVIILLSLEEKIPTQQSTIVSTLITVYMSKSDLYYRKYSLRTADKFLVVTSLPYVCSSLDTENNIISSFPYGVLLLCQALDWCPFQRNVLASGGGTADRHIRFWNVGAGNCLNSIDTHSQVKIHTTKHLS